MEAKELQRALEQVRLAMMSNRKLVFYTTILLSLKFKWDEHCDTAWVDGFTFGWNPVWFWSLTPGQRLFVMVHEVTHVALDHLGRLLGRDHHLWNAACDYVINLMGKDMGLEMPPIGLIDERFRNMNADQVYQILQSEQIEQPVTNAWTDMQLPPDKTPEQIKSHVQEVIMRAVLQAKMDSREPGHVPQDVELFLEKLLRPKLPWKTILRREVGSYGKSGYSWLKPNRRFWPQHIMPSRWGKEPSHFRFYVDISGSVEDYQFNTFVSEISGVMRMYMPKFVDIVQFDDDIKSVHRVKNLAELSKVKFKGRGGTNIEPVLLDIEKNKADLNMIFTDGWFDDWPDDYTPKQRLIWLINDNADWVSPHGKAIHFNTRKLR